MKIKVEPPFDKEWESAYLSYNKKTKRRMLCLYRYGNERLMMTYARYLMSIKLGRKLTNEEEVDHIDNDKTNDSLDNLQILTRQENIDKYHATLPEAEHGTSLMFSRGCTCHLCKEWNNNRNRKYYKEHPDKSKLKREKQIKRLSQRLGPEKICKNCGKVFRPHLSYLEAVFCSKSCAGLYNTKKNK